MRKEFVVGQPLENGTTYYATQSEYHIYFADTVTVEDERYVALRANDPQAAFFRFCENTGQKGHHAGFWRCDVDDARAYSTVFDRSFGKYYH